MIYRIRILSRPISEFNDAGAILPTYLAEVAVKYIERTIITVCIHIMNEVLHLHLDIVAEVVLAAFKSFVPVRLQEVR